MQSGVRQHANHGWQQYAEDTCCQEGLEDARTATKKTCTEELKATAHACSTAAPQISVGNPLVRGMCSTNTLAALPDLKVRRLLVRQLWRTSRKCVLVGPGCSLQCYDAFHGAGAAV